MRGGRQTGFADATAEKPQTTHFSVVDKWGNAVSEHLYARRLIWRAGRINYEIVRHALLQGHSVTLIADAVASELVADGADWIRVRPILRQPNLLKCWRFYRMAD